VSARSFAVLAAPLLLSLVPACAEPFSKGWLVDRPRLLGVRVESGGDPSRAALTPGEPATLAWLVAAPQGAPAPRLSWSFALCERRVGNYAEPRCTGAVLTTGAGPADPAGPAERATMPLVGPATEAQELLLVAAFCEAGPPPALDAARFTATCEGGSPLLASTLLRTTKAGPNRNPEIPADAVSLDGEVLPPVIPGALRCADVHAVSLARGAERTLGFRFLEEQREPTPDEAALPGSGPVEALTLSHVVTAGELDRQYSALDRDQPAPRDVVVPWDLPGDVPPEGRVVDLHLVLRDGRGGVAFARRALCVKP